MTTAARVVCAQTRAGQYHVGNMANELARRTLHAGLDQLMHLQTLAALGKGEPLVGSRSSVTLRCKRAAGVVNDAEARVQLAGETGNRLLPAQHGCGDGAQRGKFMASVIT